MPETESVFILSLQHAYTCVWWSGQPSQRRCFILAWTVIGQELASLYMDTILSSFMK